MSDLLGYVLKLDEPDERQRTEERLRSDPEAVRELAALEKALLALESDREPPGPPAGLVARTIARVAEHTCRHAGPPVRTTEPLLEELMSRMTPDRWRKVIAALDRAEAPSRWRRADFFVVASILVVGFGLVLSATPYLRHRQNVTACQNHLRQLYQAVDTYADTHQGQFPQVTEQPPKSVSTILTMLQESGAMPGPDSASCPAAEGANFSTYAYTLGYRDEASVLHGLRRDPDLPGWGYLPIAADRPALGRTSPNPDHRYGQNVLFSGGNVRFCTSGNVGVGGDDIYRNQAGQVRAGLFLSDTVLGVSGDLP